MSAAIAIDPLLKFTLRNKSTAMLTHGVGDLRPFNLMGHMVGDRSCVQLWKRSGHWHETEGGHPLDIVALLHEDGNWVAFAGIEIREEKA